MSGRRGVLRPVPTILLFDIDGTLITQKGTGRRAVAAAFERVHGRPDAVEGVAFAGRTDPHIFGDGLRRIGLPATQAAIEAVSGAYLALLPDLLAVDANATILPGVGALLDALAPFAHLARGLGTGNSEAGARVKLEHFDLWRHFDFGGYGSDAADRAALLAAGAARGAARLGHPLDACRTVVIGDTPLDVAAARAIGAECLAVTTGGDTAETLSGADRVVYDLRDEGAFRFLCGESAA